MRTGIAYMEQEIESKVNYKQKWLYTLRSRSHETSTSKE